MEKTIEHDMKTRGQFLNPNDLNPSKQLKEALPSGSSHGIASYSWG